MAGTVIAKNFRELFVNNRFHPGALVRTDVINEKTAIAILEPTVQGNTIDCAPVVPRDLLIFKPSSVQPGKSSDASSEEDEKNHYQKNNSASGLSSSLSAPTSMALQGQFKIPSAPSLEFFLELNNYEMLKAAMYDHTFKVVSKKNNDIYGKETRANEALMQQAFVTGKLPDQPERSLQQMRDILIDRLFTQIKRAILFSESIPGFCALDLTDQHSLLKTCIMDVWMVQSANFLRDQKSYLLFSETNTFYSRCWMEHFLTDKFLSTVFDIASQINLMELSFDELALLKSILIVRPDRSNLRNSHFITILHNHLSDTLKNAVQKRRPLQSTQLLVDLMALLNGWPVLDVMQENYVRPVIVTS